MLTKKEKKVVKVAKKSLYNYLLKEADKVIKEKPLWVLDLKDHFEKKGAWPLSYNLYLVESNVLPDQLFNIIVRKLGYKIGFNKSSELRIYKPRK